MFCSSPLFSGASAPGCNLWWMIAMDRRSSTDVGACGSTRTPEWFLKDYNALRETPLTEGLGFAVVYNPTVHHGILRVLNIRRQIGGGHLFNNYAKSAPRRAGALPHRVDRVCFLSSPYQGCERCACIQLAEPYRSPLP